MKCIICGCDNSTYLCDDCSPNINIPKLCNEVIRYIPGSGENSIWEQIAEEFLQPQDFRNIAFALSNELETPHKEYWQICCIAKGSANVPKQSRQWLYQQAEVCFNSNGLSEAERLYIKGLVFEAYYKDYQYQEAEMMLPDLMQSVLTARLCFTIADYYIQTRRYVEARNMLAKAKALDIADELDELIQLKSLEVDESEKGKEAGGKAPYVPASAENKQKYYNFMESIGLPVTVYQKPKRDAIPKSEYPAPVETRNAGFRSFVAFDIETTGVNADIDAIIEIAAVKVIDGMIVETEQFTFQELVHPYKKRIPEAVEELTGITNEMTKDAREIWEVFPDFAAFAEDYPLVGYNCMAFDSRFLVRAGRYSNLIIHNQYFDVMRYAEQFRESLELQEKKISLQALSEKMGIVNTRAHRALADAVTTAKCYLKLSEMAMEQEEVSLDDMLSDLEDW